MHPEGAHLRSLIPSRRPLLIHIPNVLTFLGLFFGTESIFSSINGHPLAAAYLITLASIIDTFDGAAARILHAYSAFGKHVDSLADSVTVGVAPAVLLYRVYFHSWHGVGAAVACCWTIAVISRLARFSAAPADPSYFAGLPSPPAANILSGSVLITDALWHRFADPWTIAILMAILTALMLSNVRVEKGGFFTPEQLIRSWRGRVVLLACFFAASVPWAAPFVVFSGLVILVLARELRHQIARAPAAT